MTHETARTIIKAWFTKWTGYEYEVEDEAAYILIVNLQLQLTCEFTITVNQSCTVSTGDGGRIRYRNSTINQRERK